MQFQIARIDTNLYDVSSIGEPAQVPTLVNIELETVLPLSMGHQELLARSKPPYFNSLSAEPASGKMTARSILGMSDLPKEIQALWYEFYSKVTEWADQQL